MRLLGDDGTLLSKTLAAEDPAGGVYALTDVQSPCALLNYYFVHEHRVVTLEGMPRGCVRGVLETRWRDGRRSWRLRCLTGQSPATALPASTVAQR